MSQPPVAVLHANNNGVVVFLMERRVRKSVSLTSNAYYWWSYDNWGEESMNRIPPLKKMLHFSGLKRREFRRPRKGEIVCVLIFPHIGLINLRLMAYLTCFF